MSATPLSRLITTVVSIFTGRVCAAAATPLRRLHPENLQFSTLGKIQGVPELIRQTAGIDFLDQNMTFLFRELFSEMLLFNVTALKLKIFLGMALAPNVNCYEN